jgi:hypothetical protein
VRTLARKTRLTSIKRSLVSVDNFDVEGPKVRQKATTHLHTEFIFTEIWPKNPDNAEFERLF